MISRIVSISVLGVLMSVATAHAADAICSTQDGVVVACAADSADTASGGCENAGRRASCGKVPGTNAWFCECTAKKEEAEDDFDGPTEFLML